MALRANVAKFYSTLYGESLLHAVVTFDASGVPTLQAFKPPSIGGAGTYSPAVTSTGSFLSDPGYGGIKSVVQVSTTGEYLFTVMGSAVRVLGVEAVFTYGSKVTTAANIITGVALYDAAITGASPTAQTLLGAASNVIDVLCYANNAGTTTLTKPISCQGNFTFIFDQSTTGSN